MTTPNEPSDGVGNGKASGGPGATQRPKPRTGTGEAATWHGGTPPPRQAAPRTGGSEARTSRIISGTAAPGAKEAAAKADTDAQQADAYASELPDLSGPSRRSTRTAVAETKAASPARRAQAAPRSRGPVRASMQIRRIDPWSMLKVSLILSVALFFVWMIAVAFLYVVLGSMGVWSKLNSNVGDLLNNASGGAELVSTSSIFGGAILIGLVNIVVLTAMATIGALIYNLTTDLIGGVEVTLADRD